MADSIPRAYLRELATTLAAESLKVAFFVNLNNYDPLTATTYAALVAIGASEVQAAGTGYTIGGYALTGLASSDLAPNRAKVSASATVLSSATLTYQYSVIYNATSGKIRLIKDHLTAKTVTGGTVTITWDATLGIIYFSFS